MIHISSIIPTLPVFSRPTDLPDEIELPLPGRPAGERFTRDQSGCYRSSAVPGVVFFPGHIARLFWMYKHYG